MDTWIVVVVVVVLVITGVAVLAFPVARYVKIGWEAKRSDILDSLSPEARLAYYRMFCRSKTPPVTIDEACRSFDDLYTKWYGRRFFAIPAILLLIVSTIALVAIVSTGIPIAVTATVHMPFHLPAAAVAALAGAYVWVANDFISRSRRLDFSPADVMWGVLRIAIAIPMGYAFAKIAAAELAPFIAFALGAFPLSNLLSFLRRIADRKLDLGGSPDERADEISKLQGINRAIVERLANEDVTTVSQIAYCDPIRLVMRSNLTFIFVTDCMSQALAWLYLGDALNDLRPLGLRGAVEILAFVEELNSSSPASTDAHAALPFYADAAKQHIETFRMTLQQIADDPFTHFLGLVWQDTGLDASLTSP